jgi:triosephosphate isomerase
MSKKYIVANWKMNGDSYKVTSFFQQLVQLNKKVDNCELILCLPAVYLSQAKALKPNNIQLGGQTCSSWNNGAYTGEISADMLKDVGCNYVIVGHSERRRLLQEDEISLSGKILTSTKAGLTPIYCVGEMQDTGQSVKAAMQEIQAQLKLANLLPKEKIIAYEPTWAIGTGKVADPSYIEQVAAQILAFVPDAKVLYGGSVKVDNIKQISALPSINGVLVGAASLEAERLIEIAAAWS